MTTQYGHKFFLTIAFFCLLFSSNIMADDRLIVFGDSLVDVGNDPAITFIQNQGGQSVPGLVIPPPTRYDRGRFANGPNIVDYLSAWQSKLMKPSVTGVKLRRDNVSYAYGGSETGEYNVTPGGFPVPGLLGQVEQFRQDTIGKTINFNNTSIIIWTGANDYLNTLAAGGFPVPGEIVANITTAMTKLSELGAEKIIVINQPDIGKSPICSIYDPSGQLCAVLTQLIDAHNLLLNHSVAQLNIAQENTTFRVFDAHTILDKVISTPADYGLSHTGAGPATGCLFQDPAQFDIQNCALINFNSKEFFWDEVHLSTRVHKILARKLRRFLKF